MKEQRHPHPHIDPRQPRNGTQPSVNPPVFAWKPPEGAESFSLTIARDAAFAEPYLRLEGLRDPVYLPDKGLPPGTYYWRWSAGDAVSEVFSFTLTPEALVLEVPPVREWLARFPATHPRIYLRPEEVETLRASRHGAHADRWQQLRAFADEALAEPCEMAEPPFLADRHREYEAWSKGFIRLAWESRRFLKGAETLALAFLASGETQYARAACRRLASVARWDPRGSSYLGHNDEAHMSIIWYGITACDWVWDQFTDEERTAVIAQFRERGRITFEHMHDKGCYGVTRFDSHAGREVIFLALLAFTFHEHIPEAAEWLEWLRPVLCGIWPIWAGDDGAWAEGPGYAVMYVSIMCMFASALKSGAGVNLYHRPFWANHIEWLRWCMPSYMEWMGFGDSSERWPGWFTAVAEIAGIFDHETGSGRFADYAARLRDEATRCFPTPPEQVASWMWPLRYLACAPDGPLRPAAGAQEQVLRVFPGAGWAAVRTHPDDSARDVAFIFRSSPYGSISHSHANHNDFILHSGGKVLAMPSGYYVDGYATAHHMHWVWHTKSHNCLTLSDAGQLMRSMDARGEILHAFEDERLAYMVGNADAGYADRAVRCRRHVVFLKAHVCFVLIDEFVARPGVQSSLQWNIHSWNTFAVDETQRSFLLEREGSTLEGHVLYHHYALFSRSQGWDPPITRAKPEGPWAMQHHLRFTTSLCPDRMNLGVVLCPGHAHLPRAVVATARQGGMETARIGDDLVFIRQDGSLEYGGAPLSGLALLIVQGQEYVIGDAGIHRVAD